MDNAQMGSQPRSGSNARVGRPMNGEALKFHIDDELHHLDQEQEHLSGGRAAKTLTKEETLRVTLVRANAGTTIEPSANAGGASLQVLRGKLQIQMVGGMVEAGPGDLVILPHNLQDPIQALQDSAFLLTIAWVEGTGA